ncbi:hypothetical protein F5Y10DRAFT_72272 [Nemania abortiva]|nr:hypothetical protein F5Y10DRAFT_72272 [Nemania abortiva]
MSAINRAEQVLQEAQKLFRRNLRDQNLYAESVTAKTATDVYDTIANIQETMAPKGQLRGLGRLTPLIDRLSELSAAMEALLSPESDLLALIWGPIKAILLRSSQNMRVFEKNIEMLSMIGDAFPHFVGIVQRFLTDDMIGELLTLFYQELLEFYCITLVFLRRKSSKMDFDIVWPNHKKNVEIIASNLKRYSALTTTEQDFLDIDEAREARNQSFKSLTQEETHNERAKYLGLKARVSPDLYDRRLSFLRDRCVPGCAEWLLRDAKFNSWLDISKTTLSWLWLQGIPGAGKTYLAAMIIDHMRKSHRTLFALVNHINKMSLTALSVIQSLLFQAAEDDKELRPILVETKERELHGNTEHAAGLLGTLLATAGETYIIIDGLDELEETERKILLNHLAEISESSEALRILICSRVEHDISDMLNTKAMSIRVNDRNHGSIQVYVDHRTRSLTASREFDSDTELELFSLISPLSAKANGMFLYARIIVDNLEQMSSIDEIRSELKALPNDLTEAYHRIFHRINTATPANRKRCRKILGLIGCATTPMTIFEMEHALAVDFKKEYHDPPSPLENFNFVKSCGPIIEVVEETVQFVHFTVQEYIFSPEIDSYIDRAKAVHNLASTLLAYLGSGVLDMDLDDEEIADNIVRGKYRLFEYAVFHWPTLIHQLHGKRRIHEDLLKRLVERGTNFEFGNYETPTRHYRDEQVRKNMPQVYDMVCHTFQLHLDDRRWDWNWRNSDSWVNFDPLCTMPMLVRVQESLERLISNLERVASVQRHYGTGLFRCVHMFCWRNLRGFRTHKDRDAHTTNHGRPWKCTIPDCDPFATIGFSSRSKRDDHWLKHHLHPASQIGAALDNFESLDIAEAQPILFRLVLEDRIDSVRTLLSAPVGKKLKAEIFVSARNLAIREGSLDMTKLLAPKDEKQVPESVLVSAVKKEDINFAKWAISRAARGNWTKLMTVMLSVKSDEIYALWEHYILALPQPSPCQGIISAPLEILFKQTLFTRIKGDVNKEERLKHTLIELKGRLSENLMGRILLRIAKTSCSRLLTETLLSLGAPINYAEDRKRRTTALRIASKQTTKEAAFLMKYLLENGASPGRHSTRDWIGLEKGAKEIVQWLGVTWDELLDQITKDDNVRRFVEASRS